MAIIRESEIINKKEELNKLTETLETNISSFNNTVENYQDIIEDLKVVLNTSGGVKTISKFSNIDFETTKLRDLSESKKSIQVNHTKEKVILMTTQSQSSNKSILR